MNDKVQKIFNNVVTNNHLGFARAFVEVISDKLDDALEVRKVGLTSEIFNKATIKESTDLEEAKSVKVKTKTKPNNYTYDELLPEVQKIVIMSPFISKKNRMDVAKKITKAIFDGKIKNPDISLDLATLIGINQPYSGHAPKDVVKDQMKKLKLESVSELIDLEEASLPKINGSPLEIQNQLGTLIAQAKNIKGVSEDEYINWYSRLGMKLYKKWEKMVKADPQYKKAYELGYDSGSDTPPFPKGTLAAAIWSNEYAAGAMDN